MSGDCFDVAAHYVLEADDPDVVLVHGTVLCQVEGGTAYVGQRFSHAWVEHTERLTYQGCEYPLVTCIDKSNGLDVEMPQAVYYHKAVALDVVRYSATETAKMMALTRHYGPWHDPEVSVPGV